MCVWGGRPQRAQAQLHAPRRGQRDQPVRAPSLSDELSSLSTDIGREKGMRWKLMWGTRGERMWIKDNEVKKRGLNRGGDRSLNYLGRKRGRKCERGLSVTLKLSLDLSYRGRCSSFVLAGLSDVFRNNPPSNTHIFTCQNLTTNKLTYSCPDVQIHISNTPQKQIVWA